MSKLQSELTHKELEVKKQDIRHVMVQTEKDDQCDQVHIKLNKFFMTLTFAS